MLNIYSLEQQIEAQMKASRVPGLAIAIVRDQEVIYARGFGVTSVEDGGLPVTPQTLFRIGSTNKPMTGTAIMWLVEHGKLDLDQPVKDYNDWFTLSEKGAAERVALRMLLSHTAGLPTRYQPFGSHSPAPEALEAHVREEVPLYSLVAPPGKFRKDLYYYQKQGSEKIASVGFLPEETGPTQYILIDSFYCKRIDRETLSPPDSVTWPAYAGTYSDFDTLNIQIKDNQLHLHSQENGVEFPCKPLDRTRFICEVGVVEFRIAEDDTVDSLVLREVFTFKRVEEGR